jgi:mRNA interferase MazF
MPAPGQVVLFPFPKTDATPGKLRPALLLGKLPGRHGDWLACMVSSLFHQFVD